MSFVVGLTGGIGSGKTAASDHFRSLGVTVVDADLIAREVVAPGTEALAAIFAHFGQALRQPDGSLDRRQLREMIFRDSARRHWLEALLHPLIDAAIGQQLAAAECDDSDENNNNNNNYSILVSPLLLEGRQQQRVNRILVIDVSESLQVSRTLGRDGTSAAAVKAVMQAQMPRQQRLALADDIISNSGDLARLQHEIERLHQLYRNLAAASH